MSKRLAFVLLALLSCEEVWAQSYDTSGRLKTAATVMNTSATASPVASRLTDGSAFIIPVLDTTLTARFPAGSTPADNESNAVTITRSGAFVFVFDGATWDRWTGAVSQSGTWNVGTLTSITNPVAVTGTFWQATQPVSAASLPLPTGASTLAEQQTQTTALQLIDNLPLAQGSATAGQSGVLAQGAVTTSAPTYTTGQTNPFSLTTSGALRVDGSGVTQPVSGTFWQATQPVSGTVAATQSGTWTVQPGNTPNTTPWLASIHDGTTKAAVFNLAANDPLSVAVVDGNGSQITSFGGGTQYTEGDIDASVTGTAVMWEDAADTIRVASAAKPLPVNVVAGGAGDGAIQDGATPSIEATVFDYTNSNPLAVRLTDTSGDYVGAGAGTQYADGTAVATPTGTVALGHDGANVRAITTDASGDLQVDVLTMPNVTQSNEALLRATVFAGGAWSVTPSFTDNSSTSNVMPIAALYDTTPPAITDGNAGIPRMTSARVLMVDGSATTQPVSGTVTANAGTGTFTVGGTVTANAGTGTFATDPTDEDARVLGRVKIHDGTNTAAITGFGELQTVLNSGTLTTISNPVTVTSTNLDIRDLSSASDSVTVAQATAANLNATVTDGTGALTVDGTVTANQGGAPWSMAISQTTTNNDVDVATMPANTTASGTLTAPAQTVSITVPAGASSIGLQITGTWTGQIEFEATVDGSTYVSVYASNNAGNSSNATTGNGAFILPGAGFLTVRARASALSSGTANVYFNASIGSSGSALTAPLPAGTNTIGGFNLAQVGGTATPVNTGDVAAGVQRVREAGSPSITTGQVSCANTATALVAARAGRRAVAVTNLGTTDVYVGAAAVATTTGDLLLGMKGASATYETSGAVYCIVASGTQSVSYAEVY